MQLLINMALKLRHEVNKSKNIIYRTLLEHNIS